MAMSEAHANVLRFHTRKDDQPESDKEALILREWVSERRRDYVKLALQIAELEANASASGEDPTVAAHYERLRRLREELEEARHVLEHLY